VEEKYFKKRFKIAAPENSPPSLTSQRTFIVLISRDLVASRDGIQSNETEKKHKGRREKKGKMKESKGKKIKVTREIKKENISTDQRGETFRIV